MRDFTQRVACGLSLALVATVGCGGNYSNEDLDFQAALPEQSDLVAKLPAQSLTTADSAEYYRTTRDVVVLFNGVMNGFLGLVDYVRAYPPTRRDGDVRIWGPFPADAHPTWQLRMEMTRVSDPSVALFGFHFDYHLDVRQKQSGDANWLVLFSGVFRPGGSARQGEGRMKLDTRAARGVGYPLDGLDKLEQLDVTYRTGQFPMTVDLTLINIPGSETPGAAYQYREQADGSGEMLFAFRTSNSLLLVQSRWLGSGAGRADVKVLEGGRLATGLKGTDCWAIDTRATFVRRDWEPAARQGDEATCVYGAP